MLNPKKGQTRKIRKAGINVILVLRPRERGRGVQPPENVEL